jgi:Lon protease-like protein
MPGPFDPDFESLPSVLPIFPLPGALVLPGGRLPLNIFEPRYLAMVSDALAAPRMIGMVQPCEAGPDPGAAAIYGAGCAGRLISFSEAEDGRYLVVLAGLIRFDVAEELAMKNGYRRIRPDYSRFAGDLLEGDGEALEAPFDRPRLVAALRDYFAARGLEGDFESINDAEDFALVTSLAMACPFDPQEKQALLEAISLAERAETITTIMELASLGEGTSGAHH